MRNELNERTDVSFPSPGVPRLRITPCHRFPHATHRSALVPRHRIRHPASIWPSGNTYLAGYPTPSTLKRLSQSTHEESQYSSACAPHIVSRRTVSWENEHEAEGGINSVETLLACSSRSCSSRPFSSQYSYMLPAQRHWKATSSSFLVNEDANLPAPTPFLLLVCCY
jgi:hypothetical protein